MTKLTPLSAHMANLQRDDLRAAHGILNGIFIAAPLWIIIAIVLWRFL